MSGHFLVVTSNEGADGYPIEYWNESYYNHYAGEWEHDAGLRLVAQETP